MSDPNKAEKGTADAEPIMCTLVVKVPSPLAPRLGEVLAAARPVVVRMLANRDKHSSKYYPEIPDPQSGHVRHKGFDPFRTKYVYSHRRSNLQRKRDKRSLRAVKRKQSRRSKYENHVVSKTIASYAKDHRLAVIIEDLSGVSTGRIKRFARRSKWAFSEFILLLKHKCALLGIPLLEVCPAYTSKQCSRCGSICEPNGKRFTCLACGHNDHRDANAAFNIAARAWPLGCVPAGGSGNGPSAPLSGYIGVALENAHAVA